MDSVKEYIALKVQNELSNLFTDCNITVRKLDKLNTTLIVNVPQGFKRHFNVKVSEVM